MNTLKTAAGRSARPGWARPHLGWPETGERAAEPRRVVVGVDWSPNSLAALRRAGAQARQRHAELDVVHVIPDDADAFTAASARATLRGVTGRVLPDDMEVPVRLRVEPGNPATVLLVVSAGAELLIIGAREHSEQGNIFGGYTVPRVLGNASCQVDICADHGGGRAE